MITCNNEKKLVLEYCGHWQIRIQDTQVWDAHVERVDTTHPRASIAEDLVPTNQHITIPNFQRGIEWDLETLRDCIGSASPILGTAVFGRTQTNPAQYYLLDGLQRFAAFTYVMHHIDDILFKKASPNEPNPWHVHSSLIIDGYIESIQRDVQQYSGLRRMISYNHEALLIHKRSIIAQSYRTWTESVREPLNVLLFENTRGFDVAKSREFFGGLNSFLRKPLFVQDMSGFRDMGELISTFIGLNTVRVELSAADVCRSILVDELQAAEAAPGTIAETENQFNDLLLRADGRTKSNFSPLIKVLEADWHTKRTHAIVPALFAAVKSPDAIVREFREFAEWVNFFWAQNENGYWPLIRAIGDNPAIATMMFYYHEHRRSERGEFKVPEQPELHLIAIAYLRKLLDGGVGDTLGLTINAAQGQFQNVREFIERIRPLRAGEMVDRAPFEWLRNALESVKSIETARIVFNACNLPRVRDGAQYGASYEIMAFRAGSDNWSVDHMIPQNSFDGGGAPSPGDPYKTTLRNLCPIKGSDNSSYKATDCSVKIHHDSYYATYCTDTRKLISGQPHPYIANVLELQSNVSDGDLNNRDYLCNVAPAVKGEIGRCFGAERIKILARLLSDVL